MKWLFSIRTKLFSFVFIAFLLFVGIIYWQIENKASSISQEVIDRSLNQSSRILDTRIDSRYRFIQELANGIARDVRVLPLVADQDTLTLQDLSLEYVRTYDFDVLFFMDQFGNVLARADQPDAIGINLAGRSSLLDEALSGQISSGFFSSNGKLMQAIAAPIFDNVAKDLVKGAVVLAYELSKQTAQEIVALTQSQIGIFTFTRDANGEVTGIELNYMSDLGLSESKLSYFSDHPELWKSVLTSPDALIKNQFTVNSQIQHTVFRRIDSNDNNPLGFVVAMRSAEDLQRPFKDIQQALLLTGAFCLILASLIALFMAITMSRPIIRLVEITKQIQAGLYPEISAKKHPKDEIGRLEKALLQMSTDLKEKAEFEAYLAELSSELENDDSQHLKNNAVLDLESDPLSQPNSQADHIIDNRYKVISELGSGTMGTVFLAQDLELNDKVAIKVMQKSFFEDIQGLNVKEEIRLARKITHRNVVRTFDFGVNESELFITMEYVHGYDLGQLIKKKGALDIATGVAIMKQICSAMIAAHQLGVIHRDLKPGNMIINRQGILKVMDFGLAMQVESAFLTSDDEADETKILTEPERPIMGTPRFMAPEQFSASGILDERTDIYAIGVIMYSIFNGKPPFSGTNFQQLALKHCHSEVPQMTARKEPLPENINSIILKALAKSPEDRYQSVREMFDKLLLISY
ncbi:protein kinase domain-containing protein [Glaciecola sp. 1036]|uniref:protein kinase domain-containing protein n=1 Tax=Alteromonadaceae TaxID=72275 RepID=UPI003D02EFAC